MRASESEFLIPLIAGVVGMTPGREEWKYMNCFYHPQVSAARQCERCRKPICRECDYDDMCYDCAKTLLGEEAARAKSENTRVKGLCLGVGGFLAFVLFVTALNSGNYWWVPIVVAIFGFLGGALAMWSLYWGAKKWHEAGRPFFFFWTSGGGPIESAIRLMISLLVIEIVIIIIAIWGLFAGIPRFLVNRKMIMEWESNWWREALFPGKYVPEMGDSPEVSPSDDRRVAADDRDLARPRSADATRENAAKARNTSKRRAWMISAAALASVALVSFVGLNLRGGDQSQTTTSSGPVPGTAESATTNSKPTSKISGSSATFKNFRVTVSQIARNGSTVNVKAKVCVRKLPPDPQGDRTRISWDPWSIRTSSGTLHPKLSNSSHNQLYPSDETYRVGECASGWIPFATSSSVLNVRYANGVGDVAVCDATNLDKKPQTS
jgi:hypothetical protein